MSDFRLFSEEEMTAHAARIAQDLFDDLAAGMSRHEALTKMGEASADILVERGSALADHMQQKVPAAAARREAESERLAGTWTAALDLYYTVTVGAIELGSLCQQLKDKARRAADSVSVALALLHARTCQTALEVHALLVAGFPGGAYARCRTLHELAVTTAVIAEYGRNPDHDDLADRYLDHTHVEHYQQAEHFQRFSSHHGSQPFSQETMQALKRVRDRLTSRYGREYREPYGWAAGLISQPNFARLEALANMDVLRYLYVTGSHLVHASAHGLRLALAPALSAPGGVIAGPSDAGLSQPANASLDALIDVTSGLVLHGGFPDDLGISVNFFALAELRNRARRLLNEAEGT